jgi:hypothetical protein
MAIDFLAPVPCFILPSDSHTSGDFRSLVSGNVQASERTA